MRIHLDQTKQRSVSPATMPVQQIAPDLALQQIPRINFKEIHGLKIIGQGATAKVYSGTFKAHPPSTSCSRACEPTERGLY
jgi:hypothetical protein